MKYGLKTVLQNGDQPPENRDPTEYVRKNWSVFLAYDLVTSVALGFLIPAAFSLFSVFDHSKRPVRKPVPVHDALLYTLAIMGVLSVFLFLIQVITGPFVFTKDVVCKKCHTRLRVNRIAFFAGKYSRPPKCDCGGKIEPAFLWKPRPPQPAA
jgi:hypothetical protein